MMNRTIFASLVPVGLLLAVILNPSAAADDLTPKQIKFFETKIRPVLVQHCYSCHSAKSGKTKGELALDTREGIRAGGESGHAVVPGDLDESLIISAMKYESFEMPPKKQLPANVIRDFENWIRMGAPDPRDGKSIVKNRSQIDYEKGRQFWAFQKPVKPQPPKVRNENWVASDIDRFVLSRLEAKGLQPVEDASELRLLRRDYINLIGIPPTPEQMESFVNDRSPDKRERLIDELLKSPQFGERWGRHWLDVARFAESNGRERNFLFPHAWRYRNYVIDSFNQDKPFDRFIREQLAGDLLKPLPGQDPNEPKIATGLLAIGPKLLNERNKEVFAMDMVDEQMDVVCRSTMAITVTCARCHDHKFDPFATEDYYAVAGIFRSTQTLFGKGGNGARQATGLINVSTESDTLAQARAEHEKRKRELTKKIAGINNQLKNQKRRPGKNKQQKGKPVQKFDAKQNARLRKQLKVLQQQLRTLQQSGPATGAVAMGVQEGSPRDCNVLIRGEVTAKGDLVPRGFITVLDGNQRRLVHDRSASGRLELADWIVSPDNPLTARVTVNRIWQHLFGEGIVRTVDNFGSTGERPTHPELLDYLAFRLIENGWSFKKTIREIMLSRTYRLATSFRKKNYEVDPDNRLLWRMNARRLEAEVLRDSILFAAGDLELDPPGPSMVARFNSSQGVGRGATEETFNVELPKRSVYLPVVRNAVPEPLRVFDFAEPSILVGARQVTTVPTQALFMMNSGLVLKHSRELAKKLLKPGTPKEQMIVQAYERVLTRKPGQSEISRALEFLKSSQEKLLNQNKSPHDAEELALTAFCQALFATAEFRILN